MQAGFDFWCTTLELKTFPVSVAWSRVCQSRPICRLLTGCQQARPATQRCFHTESLIFCVGPFILWSESRSARQDATGFDRIHYPRPRQGERNSVGNDWAPDRDRILEPSKWQSWANARFGRPQCRISAGNVAQFIRYRPMEEYKYLGTRFQKACIATALHRLLASCCKSCTRDGAEFLVTAPWAPEAQPPLLPFYSEDLGTWPLPFYLVLEAIPSRRATTRSNLFKVSRVTLPDPTKGWTLPASPTTCAQSSRNMRKPPPREFQRTVCPRIGHRLGTAPALFQRARQWHGEERHSMNPRPRI